MLKNTARGATDREVGGTCLEGLPPGLQFHFDRQKPWFGQHFVPESSCGRIQGSNKYYFGGQISLTGSAWWILDVTAVGLRQPTNRQQTTNNNQPTTYPTADTGATTNNQQPIDNRQPTITNQRATQKRTQERQPTTNNQSTTDNQQ